MENDPVKILLLEDNRLDARLLQLFLGESHTTQYQLTQVERLEEGLKKLEDERFQLILCDLSLADSHDLETFQCLHRAAPDIPIVVLSGSDDQDLAVQAVREGAQDYLVKGRVDATGLIRSIRYAIERHHAEERLIKSEAFYLSLVENLPQNIFRKDLNERFTFANQRFCNLLGKSLDEIIGRTDFDFYPRELAEKFQKDDRRVIETGQIFETVEENVSSAGETIYVQVVKTPIYNPKGMILGTQCIFWDITERKRFEERLQRANEELARNEAALRKSNEALKSAQLQLIQAEKMESIGTLAAGVAHEVKNPLAILMMGLTYLEKKLTHPDENLRNVLGEMREAISRADSIARGLLNFASTHQLAVQPEDLNQLIRQTLRLLRHAMKEARVELVDCLEEDLPAVSADKHQIQQVLVNLFMNSIQAMPSGGKIEVRTYAREITESSFSAGSRQGDRLWVGDHVVVVEIRDTGPGIPDEHLIKIFDPFFTTKPTGVGTGLGLPVSKKIIELHGGMLDLKNADGGGVVATLQLRQRGKS